MNIGVGKHIYSALSGLGATVFPVIANFNSTTPPTPFIVYRRTSAEANYTKSLWTGELRHSYNLTVVDNQYSNTVDLAQQVIDSMMSLTSTEKTDMYIKSVKFTDISEDYVDGLFVQNINIELNTIEK